LAFSIDREKGKTMPEAANSRPRALITGASAGIGAEFAEQLAHDGYDLVLVARRKGRLETLSWRLKQEHDATVEVLPADLTAPDDLRRVEQHLAGDDRLELLINNAGFGGYMPFIELDPDTAEELIRLNVVAVTRLTRAALPGMVARHRGAIINVASVLGFSASAPASSPLPRRAVYAACKSYIINFTELVAHELEGSGVQLQVLCPGRVDDTEFHEKVPGFDPANRPVSSQTAQGVVAASLTGLRRGELICIPGLDDPALIDAFREDERAIINRAGRGAVAARYGQ
jgi:short-subunit dehydrogenase